MAGIPFFSQYVSMISKKRAVDMLNGDVSVYQRSERREQQPLLNMVRPPFNGSNTDDPIQKAAVAGFGSPNGRNVSSGVRFQNPSVAARSTTTMASTISAANDVKIELDKADLWREFAQHTTEMVVTKLGRRMFPTLRFQISGLDPVASYGFYIVFTLVDNFRYKFQHRSWNANGQSDESNAPHSIATYQHPDSPAPGRMWMSQPLSFHRIKLTNCAKAASDMIVLSSMRKYQPRLIVVKLHENFNGQPLRIVAEFAPPETQFIAVTAYQNSCITKLKVLHNPFAKGLRQNAEYAESAKVEDLSSAKSLERKRKASESEVDPPGKCPSIERSGSSSDQGGTSLDRSLTPVYAFNQRSDFQWPPVTPQMQAFYLAAEMAKVAAAANDAFSYNRQTNSAARALPAPPISPFPMLNRPAPALFSSVFPPLPPCASLINPIATPDSRLHALWPNSRAPFGGANASVYML